MEQINDLFNAAQVLNAKFFDKHKNSLNNNKIYKIRTENYENVRS